MQNNTTTAADPELIPSEPLAWHVAPVTEHLTKKERARGLVPKVLNYELYYQTNVQETAKGEAGRARLEELARLSNQHGHAPRRAIACAADSPNPAAYLKRHA